MSVCSGGEMCIQIVGLLYENGNGSHWAVVSEMLCSMW